MMKNRKCVLGILAVAILILDLVGYVYCEKLPLAMSAPTVAAQRIIVVNSTSDSGPGTLRQALLEASSGDTITFDPAVFSPEAPATIYLASSLPPVTQGNLTIDGSNAGVVLDGSTITDERVNGLEIVSDGNIIRGLQIISFPNAAVGPLGGAENNIVGGDRGVGSVPLGQGNLLSGNGSFGVGIWDADTSFNTIIGNYIGTDLSGTAAWGIRRDGVHINGASYNQVIDNLIGGNGQSGVYICCMGEGNTIRDNYIGTDISGLNPLGNLQSGVCVDQGARDNAIGPDNIIAYNEDGVAILGPNSLGNTITQNSIHDNGHQGINLWEGGNTELAAPVILDFDLAAGTVTGAASANSTIEIFSDSNDEGEVYEGRTTAKSTSVFTFNKGASFTGPHLTATATDADGNTSEFSAPTSGTGRSIALQEENTLPITELQPKQSRELEDNRIGGVAETRHVGKWIWKTGLKWMRVICDPYGGWQKVDWGKEEYTIDPEEERLINDLTSNDIKIMLVLDVWYPENRTVFYKTEEDVERYLNYVRFMVNHFKGRIEYYEILNEPDLSFEAPSGLPLPYYVNLIKRTAPVIREEDPKAKIVVGAIPDTRFNHCRDYMWGLLRSEVMPLVDGISWHGMYGAAPSGDPGGVRQPEMPQMKNYWENYASLVREIMAVSSSRGFRGKYFVEEMLWRTPLEPHESEPYGFSDITGAKYYARATIIHLGLNVTTGLAVVHEDYRQQSYSVIRNLCTVMAGAEPTNLPVEIHSEATNIQSYSFSLPNGDTLIALWTDGVAVEEDPSVKANLAFQGFTAQDVTGIDILVGFQQPIIASSENGNLVIQNLLVRDYPLILRLSPVAKRAVFTDLTVSPAEAQPGQPVEISVKVTNVGGMESSYTVTLSINGIVEDTETITLAGGETKVVTFMVTRDIAGGYAVEVGGLTVTFTVVGPKPAEFVATDLTVAPTEVKVKQEVKITVKVTNVGEQSGSYTVDLKIAGVIVDTKTVTLGGGESTTVTFEIVEEKAGVHNVEVAGLKGTFLVKEIPPPPPPWEIYATVAAVAIVAIGVSAMIYRRRRASAR